MEASPLPVKGWLYETFKWRLSLPELREIRDLGVLVSSEDWPAFSRLGPVITRIPTKSNDPCVPLKNDLNVDTTGVAFFWCKGR